VTAGSATDHLGASLPLNYTILTYLSSDATIDFDYGVMLQDTYGTDFLVDDQGCLAPGGRVVTTYMTLGAAGAGAGSYVGHYAYFVALEMDYGSFTSTGNVAPGSYFGVSVLSPALTQYDTDPLSPQQSFDVQTMGSIQTSSQVVPEPGVFGLLAVGCGVIAMRRKFRA